MAERKAWWEILRDQFASRGLLDPESERLQEAAQAAPAVQRQARGLLSLDPQAESDTALEMGLGSLPGVGQAMALRDLERARRAKDPGAAAMAASNFIPFGTLLNRFRRGPMSELDVYHGTPHRFEPTEANPLGEFDASKIGTGEKAQAYGHGIYLAESPEVAEIYRSATNPASRKAEMTLQMTSGNIDEAIKFVKKEQKTIEQFKNDSIFNQDSYQKILDTLDYLKQTKKGKKPTVGAFYKADLPDEMIDRMLDWDKPLSEQPEFVQKAWADWRNTPQAQKLVKQMGSRGLSTKDLEKTFGNPTGAAMHKWIYEGFGSSKGGEMPKVAQFLKDKGLVGVKYQDAGSRGQGGSGTRNFVVFPGEEKKVKILERK